MFIETAFILLTSRLLYTRSLYPWISGINHEPLNKLLISGVTRTRADRTGRQARTRSIKGGQKCRNSETTSNSAARQFENKNVHSVTCQTELSASPQTSSSVETLTDVQQTIQIPLTS